MKESEIFINQVGYLPNDRKNVFVSKAAKGAAENFEICEKKNGKSLFTGALLAAPNDEQSGGGYFTGDFSGLQQAGEYFVKIGDQQSFSFSISDQVYKDLALSTLKYFTDSRCGQGICHTGEAEVYGTGEKKNVQGGWHDAGDYGRYIVAGTKTVMDMLLAYKKCPEKFAELEGSGFDLLAEIRFELEWMLQMQREDGAVYHKISCYHFCAFINPQDEKDQLVLAPVSTAATADFAGCLAYASGFYREEGANQDTAFADTLLAAAVKAQNYLFSHDDELYINPPEITTGGYGDRDVRDERYFALCALYAATGEKNYLTQALKYREDKKKDKPDVQHPWNDGWQECFGWPFVSGYGTEILLELDSLPSDLLAEITSGIITQAEKYLEISNASAFRYCSKFVFWGSNGGICDLAHIMLMAYDLTGRQDFFAAAKAQIDYILGCNPVNYCYVTGAGTKSPVNPHHRPSGASGHVFPGMLAGGPCAGLLDAYAKEHLTGRPPLKCYADATPSYSTNEVAIYWNSAFVYVLNRVR